MCLVSYKRYQCGCTESTGIDLCPMVDEAMILVDQGIPEDSPRIDRLETQCRAKSATRYYAQRHVCEKCCAIILEIGAEAFMAAKREHEALEADEVLQSREEGGGPFSRDRSGLRDHLKNRYGVEGMRRLEGAAYRADPEAEQEEEDGMSLDSFVSAEAADAPRRARAMDSDLEEGEEQECSF